MVQERYDAGLKAIRPQVSEYWLNHAFIGGNQWLWYNSKRGYVEPYPRDSERVRATVNRLWPDSRTVTSKLLQRELTFEVMPTGADDATLRGAATAQAVLEDYRIAHDWEAVRARNAWATWKGGTAVIAVDWDPKAGAPITVVGAEDAVYEGDTVETALSIAEVVVEPGVKDPERARWWIKAQALPPEEVQNLYGLDETPAPNATQGLGPFQQKMMAENYGVSSETQADLTLVLTLYERPNPKSEKGQVLVLVGEDIVHKSEWPFPWTDHLNFAVTYETENETRWTGDTVVTMARPIQVLYNAAWSSLIEHTKQAGNARMAVPESSIDLMDSMTDRPGEQIPFPDGMTPPSWLSPPMLPNWVLDQPVKLRDEIDDLLGVHDVSRGEAPVNIESGYGLSVLAEQDNTPIGKMAKSAAHAWAKVASMVLELVADRVTTTRQAAVEAPAGRAPETVNWTGESLMGQTRATIPLDFVLPRNRAAQQATADKMVQMGLIQDVETYTAVAELPGQANLVDRMRPDVAKARRENHMIAVGVVQIPAPFDDHAQHIAEHNVFRKSERWDRMTEEQQKVMNDHIQAHEVMAAEQAGQARAAAAVDPMLATVPTGDERPSLLPEQLPPEALGPEAIPGQVEAELDDAALAGEAGFVDPGSLE